jgi:hypothetical protein
LVWLAGFWPAPPPWLDVCTNLVPKAPKITLSVKYTGFGPWLAEFWLKGGPPPWLAGFENFPGWLVFFSGLAGTPSPGSVKKWLAFAPWSATCCKDPVWHQRCRRPGLLPRLARVSFLEDGRDRETPRRGISGVNVSRALWLTCAPLYSHTALPGPHQPASAWLVGLCQPPQRPPTWTMMTPTRRSARPPPTNPQPAAPHRRPRVPPKPLWATLCETGRDGVWGPKSPQGLPPAYPTPAIHRLPTHHPTATAATNGSPSACCRYATPSTPIPADFSLAHPLSSGWGRGRGWRAGLPPHLQERHTPAPCLPEVRCRGREPARKRPFMRCRIVTKGVRVGRCHPLGT